MASINITSHHHHHFISPTKTSKILQNPVSHSHLPTKSTNLFCPAFQVTTKFSPRVSVLIKPTKASLEEKSLLTQEEQPPAENQVGVEESVKVLKEAAKTRKVKADEVLAALAVIKKSKLDPSGFLDILGGTQSPGRTWMLIFTAKDQLKTGSYFPITAVQRFDAAGRRIQNGVYFGPIGCLTFEGRISWKKRILAFIFESLQVKVGPFGPLQISLGQRGDREPSNKDPFFIWFYVDEEIAVAQGRGGGTAFWCRCRRVT